METAPKSPAWIFTALTKDRGTAKEAAIQAIEAMTDNDAKDILRRRLLKALTTEYAAPGPGQVDEFRSHDTRCWILSALARVADPDEECNAKVREHLQPVREPSAWARYWALEGLIAGKALDLLNLARQIVQNDQDPLVKSLAYTILASTGDRECLKVVQDRLSTNDIDDVWAVCRALRVVPVPNPVVIDSLCSIVQQNHAFNLTFNAVVALGKIPSDCQHADTVAQALQDYLVKYRWPMYEATRTRALVGLANLRVARSATVLLEELSDGSPGIVSAAARALESVLGVSTAVARIIEAAVSADTDTQARLGAALRYMNRTSVVDELEDRMLSGSEEEQAAARNLLSEVGGAEAFQRLKARTTAATQYMRILESAESRIRELFEDSIVEARKGFRIATAMDTIVFLVGMSLIVASATLVLRNGGTLDSWAGVGITGGVGVLGVLYSLLIADPRRRVEQAVDHLMNLKIIFLGYLRQLHQTDQAYTRRLLDEKNFPVSEVAPFIDMVGNNMICALEQLGPREGRQERPEPEEPLPPGPGEMAPS